VKVPRDGDVKPLGVVCPRLAKLVKTVCEQRLVVSLLHLCVACTVALNGVVCAEWPPRSSTAKEDDDGWMRDVGVGVRPVSQCVPTSILVQAAKQH
jgi:hypothetical protein